MVLSPAGPVPVPVAPWVPWPPVVPVPVAPWLPVVVPVPTLPWGAGGEGGLWSAGSPPAGSLLVTAEGARSGWAGWALPPLVLVSPAAELEGWTGIACETIVEEPQSITLAEVATRVKSNVVLVGVR